MTVDQLSEMLREHFQLQIKIDHISGQVDIQIQRADTNETILHDYCSLPDTSKIDFT